MMARYLFGSTQVFVELIDTLAAGTETGRRSRERAATAALLRDVFGPGADIRLSHTAEGAPRLTVDGEQWHISVSHSRTRVGVALDRDHAVGLDLEEWRDTLLRVQTRYIRPDEEAEWCISQEHRLMAWMAKEAAYKAFEPRGVTLLSISLHGTEVTLGRQRGTVTFGPGFALVTIQ